MRLRQQYAERSVGELCRRFIPFLVKFRKPFLFGLALVFLTAAVSLPLPLVGRFLIDDVIMKSRLPLLVWTVLAMICLAVAGRLLDLYQQYYFDRFNREVVLDIQSGLLDRVFHYSKTFFDRNRTGYLMNRLDEDVHGMGWFFSGAMAGVIENIFRFLGGLIFLLYLDWRLTLIVGVILPGAVIVVRFFSDRLRTLSNESMEMQADVAANFQESLSAIALIKAFAAEGKTLRQLQGVAAKGPGHRRRTIDGEHAGQHGDHLPARDRPGRRAVHRRLLGHYRALEPGVAVCLSGLPRVCIRTGAIPGDGQSGDAQRPGLRREDCQSFKPRSGRQHGTGKNRPAPAGGHRIQSRSVLPMKRTLPS